MQFDLGRNIFQSSDAVSGNNSRTQREKPSDDEVKAAIFELLSAHYSRITIAEEVDKLYKKYSDDTPESRIALLADLERFLIENNWRNTGYKFRHLYQDILEK